MLIEYFNRTLAWYWTKQYGHKKLGRAENFSLPPGLPLNPMCFDRSKSHAPSMYELEEFETGSTNNISY